MFFKKDFTSGMHYFSATDFGSSTYMLIKMKAKIFFYYKTKCFERLYDTF